MRFKVAGRVVDVEKRSWQNNDGETVQAFDAYLASDSPRYGARRISGPAVLAPKAGEDVEYLAVVSARPGRRGPWLSVWCVERVPVAVGA